MPDDTKCTTTDPCRSGYTCSACQQSDRDRFEAWLIGKIQEVREWQAQCRKSDNEEVGRGGSSDFYDELQRLGGRKLALAEVLAEFRKRF